MRANERREPASPYGLAAHMFLEGWSQVWMFPDLSDVRIRAEMRKGNRGKLRARANDKDWRNRAVMIIQGLCVTVSEVEWLGVNVSEFSLSLVRRNRQCPP